MGTMRTFDPDSWTPRELVSPDGRRFTPSSRAEEGELIARRYRVAEPEEQTVADPELVGPLPTDTAAAEPALTEQPPSPEPAPVIDPTAETAPVEEAATAEPEAATAAPKARRSRTTPTTEEQQA